VRFTRAVEYIDSIRSLIRKLVETPRGDSEPNPADRRARELIESIREEFEKHMNDDLSAGRAVDGVYKVLLELENDCFPLSPAAAGQLASELSRIDTVLRVLLRSVRS